MDYEAVLCKPEGECDFCKKRGVKTTKFLWRLSIKSGTRSFEPNGYFCAYGHFWGRTTSMEKTDIGTGGSEEVDIGTGGSEEVDIGTGGSEEVDIGTGPSVEAGAP